ncbi:unnamed protein product [Phaedon cochleariae]|uniref:Uncharacterized protein n=1 Tax=Phaedon cochleariae TaxID=80249 RepID=A0A9N9SEH9_PHACE|nr:unnamed protein product [Phaedon cochleariae]
MSNVNLMRKNSDVATENVTDFCGPTSSSDYNTDSSCLPRICEETNSSKEVVSTEVDSISSNSEAVEHNIFDIPLDITNMDVIFEENINNIEITSLSGTQTENPDLVDDSTLLNYAIERVSDHEEYQEIVVNDQVGGEIEEEGDDYIRGNAEVCSPSDEAPSVDEKMQEEFGMKRKKKGNQREIRKAKRNRGEFYIGHKNKEKQGKNVKENPCIEGCANSCKDIGEDRRKLLFENYWALSHQRKKDFIVNHIDIHEVKRRRIETESRKSLTRNYFLPKGDEKIKVCRRFFMRTLDVSDKLLRYTENSRSDIETSKIYERGKHDPKNKTPASYTDYVISFINKLPAVPSHYCRKDGTRKYLPTEFKNISNLYRIYGKFMDQENINKKPNKVSLQVFKKIFKNDFNIGFHIPKKDKCLKCEKYKNSQNDLINEEQQSEYSQHIREKELQIKHSMKIRKEERLGLKYNVKKKAANNKKEYACTGGGPAKETPSTDWEIEILGILGKTFFEGVDSS